jgi:hypothetical protein
VNASVDASGLVSEVQLFAEADAQCRFLSPWSAQWKAEVRCAGVTGCEKAINITKEQGGLYSFGTVKSASYFITGRSPGPH